MPQGFVFTRLALSWFVVVVLFLPINHIYYEGEITTLPENVNSFCEKSLLPLPPGGGRIVQVVHWQMKTP